MKRLSFFLALALVVALFISCSTLPSEVREANINDTAYPSVVAGKTLVKSWTAPYLCVYSPADVGALAAQEAAKEGWHDVWVLVELESYGMPQSVHLDFFRMDTWRISIFR